MTPEQFCYWLQGFFEIEYASNNPEKVTLTSRQVETIKDHLKLVFNKQTPVQIPEFKEKTFEEHVDEILKDSSKLDPAPFFPPKYCSSNAFPGEYTDLNKEIEKVIKRTKKRDGRAC